MNIRQLILADEYQCLSTIGDDEIDMVINDERTKMEYAMVGDAVYEVLFYLWIYRNGYDVDRKILDKGRSNSMMSSMLKRSRISNLSGKRKSDGDLVEALLGLMFIHMEEEGCPDITFTLYDWMNSLFSIEKYFDNLVVRRISPCGVPQREMTYVIDILPSLRASLMKLEKVYSGYGMFRGGCRSCADIDLFRQEKVTDMDDEDVILLINSDDTIGHIGRSSRLAERTVGSRRASYSNFETGDDHDILLLLEGVNPE